MKRYTVFYKGCGSNLTQPIYVDKQGQYWLGGNKLEWILTTKKVEAEAVAKKVRKQRSPTNYDDGVIFVEQAKMKPWSE